MHKLYQISCWVRLQFNLWDSHYIALEPLLAALLHLRDSKERKKNKLWSRFLQFYCIILVCSIIYIIHSNMHLGHILNLYMTLSRMSATVVATRSTNWNVHSTARLHSMTREKACSVKWYTILNRWLQSYITFFNVTEYIHFSILLTQTSSVLFLSHCNTTDAKAGPAFKCQWRPTHPTPNNLFTYIVQQEKSALWLRGTGGASPLTGASQEV